jgi:hypothetical protein
MKFLADENFNNNILRGVWRRIPDAHFTRVQDTEIYRADDPLVLEYAAQNGFIILTHDVNTMRGYFYARMRDGLSLPGLKDTAIGLVIDSIELIILASDESDWIGKATYIPLD